MGKESACNAGDAGGTADMGSILGPEDALDEGMAILQYSCLENPMDRGAGWATGLQRVGHD